MRPAFLLSAAECDGSGQHVSNVHLRRGEPTDQGDNQWSRDDYSYDGEGRRVKKVSPAGMSYYVYDASGQLAAEYGPSSTDGGTKYVTVDSIGSTRMITTAAGNVDKNYDYLPFGEDIRTGTAGRDATAKSERG